MSNPEAKATDTQGKQEPETKSEPTFTDRVNDAVKSMSKNDDGEWVLPDGDKLSEEVRVAAISERRYRDTQGAYTKAAQRNKALEAENSVLLKKAVGNVQLNLTAEQTEELDDLKFSDPEAWRKKLNKYEQEAAAEQQTAVSEEVKNVSSSTLEEQEKERRKEVLIAFKKDNPDFEINDEVLKNDIPPRITSKLENGSITFEDFLQECHDYLLKGKVVKQTETVPGQPSLGKVGGGATPSDNAVKEDILTSYNTETF